MTSQKPWNWQDADWPNWRFDPAKLHTLEEKFLLNSGRLLGAWQHLASQTQEQLKIDLLSDEALKTSEIEGEYLDRDSVRSSVRRQFGLQVDRRAGPSEAGIAELMVSCFNGFGETLTDNVMFQWHKLICAGRTDLTVIGG